MRRPARRIISISHGLFTPTVNLSQSVRIV
jgi:hypothetical protein